jgi:serine/threonine protein kinase
MHRDLKLANILVNFPSEDLNFPHEKKPELRAKLLKEKLKNMNLLQANIEVKIADLGFARELSYEDLS